MKRARNYRWQSGRHHLPGLMQVVELLLGVLIVASGPGLLGVLVAANPDDTPPTVPTNLQVVSTSPTDISISWSASSDDTAVSGYYVYRNGVEVGAPSTTTYNDTGLTPSTSYSYTVSAYDAAGNESAPSLALQVSTQPQTTAPSVPTDLHQTGQTDSSVTINWDASTDNVAIAGYNIYRNGQLVGQVAGTSFTDSGLSAYTNYDYEVSAYDAYSNTSGLSAILNASTSQDTTPPSVPDNVHQTGSTNSSISLAWNASTDSLGVAGYYVYRDGELLTTTNVPSFTDNDAPDDASYSYTISAYDSASNISAQSSPYYTNAPNDNTPPTIPTNLQTTQVKDDSISLSWNASSDSIGVAGYKIYRNNALVGTSTTNSFTDSGLSPLTNYSYTVAAYDAANNVSAESSSLSTQTAYDTTPPSIPTNLTSPTQTDTSISLYWDASSDRIGVAGYNIYRNGNLVATTTGTDYADTGLTPNTSYTYTVNAYDEAGNSSSESSAISINTTVDNIPPSTPTGLNSPNQTSSSVSLSWIASTDNVGVTGYDIYRNGNLIANVTGTTYTNSGLNYSTQYSYSVSAIDTVGNQSAQSSSITVTTPPDTIPPLVQLNAPPNGQTVQLTFPISATASDAFGITEVNFYANSTLIATITSPPYTFNWNSYAVHNVPVTITAQAVSGSGNTATDSVNVNVNNPPPTLVGDFTDSHMVNITDLSILLSNWNKTNSVIEQSLNHSGPVGIIDLSILLSHYGENDSNYH